jgi:hypothetical protein
MARKTRMLMVGTLLLIVTPLAGGHAQSPTLLNPDLPNPLPGLPRPADQPQSLFLPASTPPIESPLPGPYFEEDPRLDPPQLPPPGWYTDLEIDIIGAHFKNHLVDAVQLGGPSSPLMPNLVHVAPAELDWTVAPRIELGYRLPSGFGAVAVAYRGFATQGTNFGPSPTGIASLKSRLDLNVIDFDYNSWEFSLWPNWDMKWFVGTRLTYLYYDASAQGPGILQEPEGEAAAGGGVFGTATSNSYVGFGPHFGLELSRKLAESGLAIVGCIDSAIELGRIRQGFFEQSKLLDTSGLPLVGQTRESSSQAVPMINTQLGVSWQPPGWHDVHLFAGYEYEYWWNAGRLSKGLSRGELSDQGVALRAEFNF